jgi:hypothetical protein
MQLFRRVCLVLFFSALLPGNSSRAVVPTAATRALLDATPGLRVTVENERLSALYGVPFASDSDPGTTTDDFVNAFLAQHADALGVDGVQLTLRNKHLLGSGKLTVYTYSQVIEGLPVHGSVVKITVLMGTTEKIGYIGMRLVPLPAAPLPADQLNADQAVAAVAQTAAYANLATSGTAEKVIFEDAVGSLHRAWHFLARSEKEAYYFFVDTNTGTIVAAEDASRHADPGGCLPIDRLYGKSLVCTRRSRYGVGRAIVGGLGERRGGVGNRLKAGPTIATTGKSPRKRARRGLSVRVDLKRCSSVAGGHVMNAGRIAWSIVGLLSLSAGGAELRLWR